MSGRTRSSKAEEVWLLVSAVCASGGSSAACLKKGFQAAGWPGVVPLQALVQLRSCAARLPAARSMSHRACATLEATLQSIWQLALGGLSTLRSLQC
jgi:hypothetical protein